MKLTLKSIALGFLLLHFQLNLLAQNPSKRPNIVFIMSDDHAYQAISAYDQRFIQTPNIDRIGNNGIRFTNASVTNSLCAPARATILTGKHSHINGKVDNFFQFDTTNITFPQLLQQAGYQTAMFGKLHFGNNPKGFDEFKILPDQGNYYNPDFISKKEGNIKLHGYVTDLITDMTLNWLDKERNPEQPFMLMFLHKAPHRSWMPAERDLADFTSQKFPLPATLFDDFSGHGKSMAQAEMNILKHMAWSGDNKVYPEVMKELGIPPVGFDIPRFKNEWDRLDDNQRKNFKIYYDRINAELKETYPKMSEKDQMIWKYQRFMQDYLATVHALDQNIGRVLDYLDEHHLTENTIIVYTSDQGFYLGEHGWFDKRFIYNESLLTPLLISWQGKIQPGRVSSKMVQNLDYAQTFLEAAGVPAPKDMQGESMVGLLTKGENAWTRDEIYYHYYEFPAEHWVNRHYGIVTEKYKLIHYYFADEEWELIDRKNDPMELKNVFNDPAYRKVRDELMERAKQVRKKYKDSDELSKKYVDEYMNAIKNTNQPFGVDRKKVEKIIEEWEKD